MDKSNKIKTEFLGIPFGTACGRLRKAILFSLIQETGKDICFRCDEQIENVDDLSIEHKQPWLHQDINLFWDLGNIAFAHLSCNSAAGRRPHKIEVPLGEGWCYRCKEFFPTEDFYPDQYNHAGLRKLCKACSNEKSKLFRRAKRDKE